MAMIAAVVAAVVAAIIGARLHAMVGLAVVADHALVVIAVVSLTAARSIGHGRTGRDRQDEKGEGDDSAHDDRR
jgi:hypothetical protein